MSEGQMDVRMKVRGGRIKGGRGGESVKVKNDKGKENREERKKEYWKED